MPWDGVREYISRKMAKNKERLFHSAEIRESSLWITQLVMLKQRFEGYTSFQMICLLKQSL